MPEPAPPPPPPQWLLRLAAVVLLASLPWLWFSARFALGAGRDCDIWRQWVVGHYLFAGTNPYAISLGILEKNYGKMSGETRRRLKDFVIYEVHPSLDATGIPGFRPDLGPPTATYPPSSLLTISLMGGGWLPAGAVHHTWLALNLVFLVLLIRHFSTAPPAGGPAASGILLVVAALLLSWPPIHEALRTLQFIIPVTWFIGQTLRWQDRNPWVAGLFLAAALIKPSAALPFVLIPLLRGRWTTVALAGALHLAATLVVAALVDTPPLDLFRDWLRIPGYMLQGAYSIQEVINALGWDNTPAGLAASLGLAGGCGLWALLHRRASPAALAAFLALASVWWTYHERYDFVLLLFPAVLVLARLRSAPRDGLAWLLAAALVVAGLALTDAAYLHDAPGLRLLRWGGRGALAVLLAGTAWWVRADHRAVGRQ